MVFSERLSEEESYGAGQRFFPRACHSALELPSFAEDFSCVIRIGRKVYLHEAILRMC